MTEAAFVTTAENEMISISNLILASINCSSQPNTPYNSPDRVKQANDFEAQFSDQTHAMLFNLLREFERINHSTISVPTGREIEQIYDSVLLSYGSHIACGSNLKLK